MVIISESDGATLDFKRCSSGDLGMPLDRNACPMLPSEPEGVQMPV
jgi:hypothetical protein